MASCSRRLWDKKIWSVMKCGNREQQYGREGKRATSLSCWFSDCSARGSWSWCEQFPTRVVGVWERVRAHVWEYVRKLAKTQCRKTHLKDIRVSFSAITSAINKGEQILFLNLAERLWQSSKTTCQYYLLSSPWVLLTIAWGFLIFFGQ